MTTQQAHRTLYIERLVKFAEQNNLSGDRYDFEKAYDDAMKQHDEMHQVQPYRFDDVLFDKCLNMEIGEPWTEKISEQPWYKDVYAHIQKDVTIGGVKVGTSTSWSTTGRAMSYHIIIAGSRTFTDYDLLERECDKIIASNRTKDITIISGTAQGADQLGERYAKERGLPLVRMPADWKTYGHSAGYVRNRAMASKAQVLILFWDGESKGSKHMRDVAIEMNLWVFVVRFKP